MLNDPQADTTAMLRANSNAISHHDWQWLMWIGIALIILGTLSILIASLTTLVSVIIFGIFLLLNSSILIYQSFKLWQRQHKSKFFFQLTLGILYALMGVLFVVNPVHLAISLTLVLAVFYIILGTFRCVLALLQRPPSWGWLLFSALITVVLGILIIYQWPVSGLWVIGVFVGIDIITIGWAFIINAVSLRRLSTP